MEKRELKITTKRHPDVLLENIRKMIVNPQYKHTDRMAIIISIIQIVP